MKVEVTPEQYQAIRRISDECSRAVPPICIDPYTPNPEFERYMDNPTTYFDEITFEKEMRELLGDEVVEASRSEGVQLVVVYPKTNFEGAK